MSLAPSLSQQAAQWATGLTLEAVPASVRERARALMLDALGIGLASSRYPFARQTLDALDALNGPGAQPGDGAVPVLGLGRGLGQRDAALLNGLLIHGLDYDDTHPRGVVHATTSVLPAALAVAARQDASGAALLVAYVAGMELTTRLGVAAGGAFHQAGFHPTGLLGTFGAALAASRLLGQTPRQAAQAQGIALSLASGNLEFLQDGSGTKRLHPGWAAASGISAAYFAAHGMSGPRAAYEGRYGLYASHLSAPAALEGITATLGHDWEIPQVAVKPMPACHFTHAAADAAAALHAQWDGSPVRRIRALLPAPALPVVCEPVEQKRAPQNAYESQFSIPYSVATGLRLGRFGLEALEPEAYTHEATLALARLVSCEADPDADFPRHYSGEVIVELQDGRVLRHREAVNRGGEGRPVTQAEIEAKFFDNATRAVPRAHAQRIRDAVLDMETLASARTLASLLGEHFPGHAA
jgi:2-methylcitrate dehydratase PrpD